MGAVKVYKTYTCARNLGWLTQSTHSLINITYTIKVSYDNNHE